MTKKLSEKFEELTKELDTLRSEAKEKEDKRPVKIVEGVPFKIGGAYYIRTVTYHCTGRVKAIIGNFLVLDNAAWIADSGRFREAIMKGILNEVEPVEVEMYVNLNSIADAFEWNHKLPDQQK